MALGAATAVGVASAATIVTGANCSLADAITSANTNAAAGGCVAGSAGRDTIVTGAVTLTAPNNGVNGLPVITGDLRITSPDPAVTSFITRDSALGTPEIRLFEIGTANDAPEVTLARIWLENGRVSGSFLRPDAVCRRWRLHLPAQRLAHARRQRAAGMHGWGADATGGDPAGAQRWSDRRRRAERW